MALRTPSMQPRSRTFQLLARAHRRLRGGLVRLNERAWFRTRARTAVDTVTALTFALVRTDPAVATVYLRGSWGHDSFVPLVSDIDPTLVIRQPRLGRSMSTTRAVLGRLVRVMRLHPFVDPTWQHFALDSELAVLAHHW